MGQNKKVIYTCLVGGYDELLQPLVIDETYDYICFSNDIKDEKVGVWLIRPIPFVCKDIVRLSRYVKILPHKVLDNYEYSLWIDANLQITEKMFYEIVNEKINSGGLAYQVNHSVPPIDCIYEEMKFAYMTLRCGFIETMNQYWHLKRDKFPSHWGLFENNVILRKHHSSINRTISEEWWNEYIRYTRRDQFSLMYVYWKNNFMPELLLKPDECSRNVLFLKWNPHIEPPKTLSQKRKREIKMKLRRCIIQIFEFL